MNPNDQRATEDNRRHLLELVKDFDTAMLATRTGDDVVRGRPMGLADVQDDGLLWFCSDIQSPKVEEIQTHPEVGVFFQGKMKFASVSGKAKVVRDRALIDKMWKADWKVWFPEGKDDPRICLIAVDPTEGEYWDNQGAQGIKYVGRAVKALITGERPEGDDDQNAKVKL